MLALTVASCGAEPARQIQSSVEAEVAVLDSSGIRIVDNGEVTGRSAPFRLSDEPMYRIGWDPNGHLFTSISAGVLLADGSAVIADGEDPQIILIGSGGEFEGIIAPGGQGPGEVGYVSSMSRIGGDTVVVLDLSNARIDFFHERELVEDIRVDYPAFALTLLGKTSDGAFALGMPPQAVPMRYDPSWYQVPIVRLEANTQVADTIALADFLAPLGGPFIPNGANAISEGRVAVGRSDRPEIRWFSGSGDVEQIARWTAEAPAISRDLWELHEASVREAARESPGPWLPLGGVDELLASQVENMASRPFFGREWVSDPRGDIWMAEYILTSQGIPSSYYVIDSDGRWVGRVAMPAGFELLDVGDDRVVGIERGPYREQAVAVYRIDR